MNTWFTVKVKYTKQLDNGALKKVTEPYLLAAMSFTDAEARIYDELGSIIRGEFNVVSIARTEIHDIFHYDDTDVWYKCTVKYEKENADTNKKAKTTQYFLVSANSVKQAYERMKESLSTLLVDYEIPSVVVSPIVDIFPYAENLDREISRKPVEEVEEVETSQSMAQLFANQLEGQLLNNEILDSEIDFALEQNLVVIYGNMLDTVSFRGAITNDYEAYIDTEITISDIRGRIEVIVKDIPWKFDVNVDHAKFTIYDHHSKDERKPIGEGVVIDLNEI